MRDRTNKNAPWRQPQEPDTGGLIAAAAEFVQRGRKAQAAVDAQVAALTPEPQAIPPADLRAVRKSLRKAAARRPATNAGDDQLRDLLHERMGLRSRQLEGLRMLVSAMQSFTEGDDTHCWWFLLEAMVSGDEVAEARARVCNGRTDILRDWRPQHGLQLLASEYLLLGDFEGCQ